MPIKNELAAEEVNSHNAVLDLNLIHCEDAKALWLLTIGIKMSQVLFLQVYNSETNY